VKFFKAHKVMWGIFLLAFVLRVAYACLSIHFNGDLIDSIRGADGFFALSENIQAGNGYTIDAEPPFMINSVRPPVMPYLLAGAHALFQSWSFVLVLYIALGSLVPLLGMLLAGYITERKKIHLWVGILLAIEPVSILFSTMFYSETLFTVFFLSSIIFFFRYLRSNAWSDVLISSALLGIAVLTKPVVQYLPIVLVAALLWHHRKSIPVALKRGAVFALVFLAVISPWVYRNYSLFGVAGISSQSSVNLYSVLVPSVLALEKHTDWGTQFKAILAQGAPDPNRSTIASSSEYVQKALPILASHKKELVLLSLNTGLNFFVHDGMYDVLRKLELRPDLSLGGPALFLALRDPVAFGKAILHYLSSPFVLVLVGRIVWILVTILFVVGGAWYALKKRELPGTLALIIVFYFMLTTLVIGFTISARYRLPVNAFVLTFALMGLSLVWDWLRPKLSFSFKRV
jgi:4-amino-4-deoxy-L-arabinose transferase-like glycosyltransferase